MEIWVEGTDFPYICQTAHMHSLHHGQHLPSESYICYNQWTYIDTSQSSEIQFTLLYTAVWSILLVWKNVKCHVIYIPWTDEPSRLQSIGSQRVGYDWSDWAHTYQHSIIQNSFTAVKILCALPIHFSTTLFPISSPSPDNHCFFFTIFIVLPFSECNIVEIIQHAAFSDFYNFLSYVFKVPPYFSWLGISFPFNG